MTEQAPREGEKRESQGQRTAPAPAPPPAFAQRSSSQEFHAGGWGSWLGLLVLVVAVIGLGLLALWGGGRLAAASTPWLSPEVDKKLGALAAQQFALTTRECTNPEAQLYVEEIVQPLLDAAGEQPFSFEFRVIDEPSVNAFALPGGYITVHAGLLAAAETGEEVAGVLGHEIQHVLLRHGTKRMLRQMGGSLVLSLLLGGTDLHAVGRLASQLAGLSYDRDQESEADQEGVDLLVRAGLDPSGLAVFFERLQKETVTLPELLSTHPDPGNRAQQIRSSGNQNVTKKLRAPQGIVCHLPQ